MKGVIVTSARTVQLQVLVLVPVLFTIVIVVSWTGTCTGMHYSCLVVSSALHARSLHLEMSEW